MKNKKTIKSWFCVVVIFFLILAGESGSAGNLANASDLDQTFGNNGIKIVDIDYAYGIALQSDGKLIVVGSSIREDNSDIAIMRLLTNGNLDKDFGDNGLVTLDIYGGDDSVSGVVLQPDEKIVVVGSGGNPNEYDLILVRYNSSGTLDTSFGNGGIVITDLYDYENGFDVVLQTDGKLIVVGEANNDFILLRYNTDGSLDQTFGNLGFTITDIFGDSDVGYDITLQSDNKIIAVGFGSNPQSSFDIVVIRYQENGNIDTSFGTNGIVTMDVSGILGDYSDWDIGYSIETQLDNKILVVGMTYIVESKLAMLRFDEDGSLDSSFGANGVVIFDEFPCEARDVALQPDGKIIVVGNIATEGTIGELAIWRFHNDGSADQSFGNNGVAAIDMFDYEEYHQQVIIQPDGKILVVEWGLYNEVFSTKAGIVRFRGDNFQIFLPMISANP